MSDVISVSPDRATQAAGELEKLRDTLATNVSIIVSTLNMYWSEGTGTPENLSPLQRAQSGAPGEATAMRTRAELAIKLGNTTQAQAYNIDGMVTMPGDMSQVDTMQAQADAQALTQAEASGNIQAIQAIQKDISDHLNSGDNAWLTSFYNDAGPQVANLAQSLHNVDAASTHGQNNFTVLTTDDQKILGTFGQGLAAADKAGLNPGTVSAIVNAKNVWSAAMLVKYGPSGSSWATAEKDPQNPSNLDQPSLLSQLTVSVFKAQQNGTLRIPIGGGGLTSFEQQASAQQKDGTSFLQDQIANFEPLSPLLQADAQNGAAAQQTLGNNSNMTFNGKQTTVGSALAQELLALGSVPGAGNIQYTYSTDVGNNGSGPSYVTAVPPGTKGNGNEIFTYNTVPPSVLASFLNAATSGGRGAGDPNNPINQYKLSAQAAANIIMNTPTNWSDNGKPQSSYDPAVEQALTTTFMRYLPDIAASVGDKYSGQNAQVTNQIVMKNGQQVNGPWSINIPSSQLSNYLMQISADPTNYGNIKAAVANKMGVALGMKLNGVSDGTNDDPFADLSSLYGALNQEKTNLGFNAGQEQDAQNAEMNSLIQFGESEVGSIPFVGPTASKILSYDQKLSLLGFPKIPQFSTNNASTAVQQGRQNFTDSQLTVMVPIVQGLIQEGKIQPQPSWYNAQTGQVTPNQDFYNWWRWQKGMQLTNASEGGQQKQLDEWCLEASQWMGLGGAGFDTTGSGTGGG